MADWRENLRQIATRDQLETLLSEWDSPSTLGSPNIEPQASNSGIQATGTIVTPQAASSTLSTPQTSSSGIEAGASNSIATPQRASAYLTSADELRGIFGRGSSVHRPRQRSRGRGKSRGRGTPPSQPTPSPGDNSHKKFDRVVILLSNCDDAAVPVRNYKG